MKGSWNGHSGLQAQWRVPVCLLMSLGFLDPYAHPHSWGHRCSLDAEEDIVEEYGVVLVAISYGGRGDYLRSA